MRMLKKIAPLLLAGLVVLAIQACDRTTIEPPVIVVEEPGCLGERELRPVSPDDVLQEFVLCKMDSLGGTIDRSYVTNPVGAKVPCPCCPDWMAMTRKSAPRDSLPPGCCRDCYGRSRVRYGSPHDPIALDTKSKNILSDDFEFGRGGIIIAEFALEFSRSHDGSDTVDVTFQVSLADSGSESKTPDSREKTWRIPGGDGNYSLQWREEFEVGPAGLSIYLTGISGLAGGSDSVKARVMHLSYFPDLN